MAGDSSPLDLQELFARPWQGEGRIWKPWWLRPAPLPDSFRFRSKILNASGDSWDVLDTTVFPDGSEQRRLMHCQRIAPERLWVTGEDMPAGAEVRLRSDGFDFTPYVVRTRVLGRLSLGLRCLDSVQLMDDGRMIDKIEARLFGICVARVRIVLCRARR
jgi:hypothetical protein